MPRIVGVNKAKNSLSRLMEEARGGQEVILTKWGKPWVCIVRITAEQQLELLTKNPIGGATGKSAPPLSEEELALGYMDRL